MKELLKIREAAAAAISAVAATCNGKVFGPELLAGSPNLLADSERSPTPDVGKASSPISALPALEGWISREGLPLTFVLCSLGGGEPGRDEKQQLNRRNLLPFALLVDIEEFVTTCIRKIGLDIMETLEAYSLVVAHERGTSRWV